LGSQSKALKIRLPPKLTVKLIVYDINVNQVFRIDDCRLIDIAKIHKARSIVKLMPHYKRENPSVDDSLIIKYINIGFVRTVRFELIRVKSV